MADGGSNDHTVVAAVLDATTPQPHEPKSSSSAKGHTWPIVVIIGFFVVVVVISIVVYFTRQRRIRRMTIEALEAYSASAATAEASTSSTGGINLSSIPVFVYSSESHEDRLECPVCLTEFKEKETVRLLPACNHGFHDECIYKWFQSHLTCPLCRSAVDQHNIDSNTSL